MHLTDGRESSTICGGASGAVSVHDLRRRLRRRIDDYAHFESVGLSVGPSFFFRCEILIFSTYLIF